jgi:hypothetical protein
MKKHSYSIIVILIFIGIFPLFAQLTGVHGTDSEYKRGLHDGNQFRTSFWNDGSWGIGLSPASKADIFGGEWPINSGHIYLVDGNVFVISEVNDNYDPITKEFLATRGTLRHIQSTVKSCNIVSSCGDRGPSQSSGPFWWTFLPLPGFSNPNNDKVAMIKGGKQWFEPADKGSWPPYWPDIADPTSPIFSADGWAGDWNGYFGRGKYNSDQESYFVSDDYAKQEFPGFRPDTNDVSRGGLGIRMSVRGFQWSKGLVQDAIFVVHDLKNIGTYRHSKMVFGFKIGNNVGDTKTGGDVGGDCAAYNKDLNLAWNYDATSTVNSTWGTQYGLHTGLIGVSFLESPGNPYDGIDNDNDGNPASPSYAMKDKEVGAVLLRVTDGMKTFYAGSGPVISTNMFVPSILGLNDNIVLIDYNDVLFKRTVKTFKQALLDQGRPNDTDTLVITVGGFDHKFSVGDTLKEIGDNLFDDNLNGIIDENRGVADPTSGVVTYLYVGNKYIDYTNPDVTTNGSLNPLIDERRNDGVDNNDNWDPMKDDVGRDGLGGNDKGYPGPDVGERDGLPSEGEPHFDKTDIGESDMIGLTSFYLYPWSNQFNQWDDEKMWQTYMPGTFVTSPVGNVEVAEGSGYFPLLPNTTERFSIGIMCASAEPTGMDSSNLFRTCDNVAKAYNLNYNFAKAPDIPSVRAIVGDRKVILFWDSTAEASQDPISSDPNGLDFEGYKIYRSTDPGWNDCEPITDSYGAVLFRKPLAQFDLTNGIKDLAVAATQGVHFYLGNDQGLKHMWIDTTVKNGQTYYYAVTSYDHGDPSQGIDPAECAKFIAVQADGIVLKGPNVVVVRPEAPSAGYVAPSMTDSRFTPGPSNTTSGSLDYKIIKPQMVKNHTYRVTFKEGLSSNSLSMTKSFSLIDVTADDTLLKDYSAIATSEGFPITDGFQLSLAGNPDELTIDTSISGWSRSDIRAYLFKNFSYSTLPVKLMPANFIVVFDTIGIDTSTLYKRSSTTLTAIPVNFKIINTLTNQRVKFALWDRDKTGGAGKFTYRTVAQADNIIILNPYAPGSDSLIASWQIEFSTTAMAPDTNMPGPGDTLYLNLDRPFLSHDTFEFTMVAPFVDQQLAKTDLDKIRVVPNPYVATNTWEPVNTYSTGRGARQLHFIHLPANCTIQIFTINGQLVNTLHHTSSIEDGTVIWNMLSKDNLEISYGIYVYHVKAEGIGEKIGKFLVLK